MIFNPVPVQILDNVVKYHRKISFHRCIGFVFRFHADGKGRGVGFIIKCGGGLERTVGLEGEKGIVTIPDPDDQMVGQSGIGIRIGCIEFSNNWTNSNIFSKI